MENTTLPLADRFQDAVSAYENGDLATAVTASEALLAENPEFGDAHNLLSAIAQDQDRLAEAETYARAALQADPNNPIYLNTLGNAVRRLGRTDEAIDVFELARRGLPDQPDILFNLGNALRDTGRFDEAVDAFRASLAISPGVVPAYNNLAITLKAMGDPEGAATVLIEGLAYAPKSPDLRFNLGNALQASGRLDAAESAYRRAVDLRPEHPDAWVNLGVVCAAQDKTTDAEACFRHAITLDKNLAQAYVGLADLADDGSLDGIAHRRSVLAMAPGLAAIHSSLLMCLQYPADTAIDDLAEEHRLFGERHPSTDPPTYSSTHDFTPERPLKLGVVSGDFRFHAMRFFALPVLATRDRSAWSLTCYSSTAHPDAHTKAFRQAADRWRDVRAVSDDALTNLIVKDEIDILIDLSGHAPHNRLLTFTDRPAPLQVAWGDYVDTRGVAAIDILIGDATHTPPEDDARYVERVVRLPTDYICYVPPPYLPPAAQAPALQAGCVTFGTFSELTKIQPETVRLWAEVLKANPDSRFLANGYLLADEVRQGRLLNAFADYGVASDRILIGAGGEHAEFLEQYAEVDVILDTWPYSGGLTTCEALAMGVPVVTLTGERFCGRHATAHLRAAGQAQWVAASEQEFVEIATALASNMESLSAVRRTLRKAMLASPLCDVTAFSTAFFGVLRDEWQARCEAE